MHTRNSHSFKNKIIFPHPVLRTFQPKKSSYMEPPYAYQPFLDSYYPGKISPNLVRTSHKQPVIGRTYGVLVHPMHPASTSGIPTIYQRSQDTKIKRCKICKTILTTSTMTQYNQQCLICRNSLPYLESLNEDVANNLIFDIADCHSQQKIARKILFVIEANEHLYATNIHKIIGDIMKGLNSSSESDSSLYFDKDIEIGFVFYNNCRAYFINLQNQQICVVQPSQYDKYQLATFPISTQELLKPVGEINISSIEEILENIMYEAYFHTNNCLEDLLGMFQQFYSQIGAQIKVFTHHLPTLQVQKPKKHHQSIQLYILNDKYLDIILSHSKHTLFRQSTNTLHKQNSNSCQNIINIDEFYNIYKVYSHEHANYNEIYYDLYNQIIKQCFYNVKCTVGTSNSSIKLEHCIQKGNKIADDRLLSIKQCDNKKSTNFERLTQNQNILFDFTISSSPSLSQSAKNIIYLQFDFFNYKKISIFKRIIIIPVPALITCPQLEAKYINDETTFYCFLLRSLSNRNFQQKTLQKGKNKTNKNMPRKQNKFYDIIPERSRQNIGKYEDPQLMALHESIKKLVFSYFFYASEKPSKRQCSIPSIFSHILLYLFMFSKQHMIFENYINQSMAFSQMSRLVANEGLETFVKVLYPKVYEIICQNPKDIILKTRKFKPQSFSFQKSPLVIVDNGCYLYLIIDQDNPHRLKPYLGTTDLEQISQLAQIPQVDGQPLNKKLRQLIQELRCHNKLYYLPIEFILQGSKQFDNKFGNYLYTDNEHHRYLEKMLMQIFTI